MKDAKLDTMKIGTVYRNPNHVYVASGEQPSVYARAMSLKLTEA